MRDARRNLWLSLGPGILFAGAAVGVSHLVQSTRAGASFGLSLIVFALLANLFKYAPFRFGPEYTAATGHSLLEGYRRQGRWALVLYGFLTVATMFTVLAAVSLVTAALGLALFQVTVSPIPVAAGLITLCAGLLAMGHYRWLDRVGKVVVAVLTISTLVATALALPKLSGVSLTFWPERGFFSDDLSIFFLAAFVGWMPSAIDVAVWQSLWTLARADDTDHMPTVRESRFDFHVGYLGTVVLALCFLLLGAAVMHGSGREFAPSAGAFATQILELYAETLGAWSRPVIGTCALAVMFSTTLTVVDGFPRALAALWARWRRPEQSDVSARSREATETRSVYWVSLGVVGVGSIVVLWALLESLKTLVDLATTLSFLTAPALAALNHRAMFSADVPTAHRPSRWVRALSLVSIAVLGAFALYYVFLLVERMQIG